MVNINSSGQIVFVFSHIEGIIFANEEVDEIAGGMGVDSICKIDKTVMKNRLLGCIWDRFYNGVSGKGRSQG